MTDSSDKRYKNLLTNSSSSSSQLPTTSGGSARLPSKHEPRRIRRLSPMGMRVVVRIEKSGNVTDTGLYLPEGAKDALNESILAEVIEVASALDSTSFEETNVSGVPLGAKVLIPKNSGVRVPWDDQLRLVETKEVLAIVDEIHLS